MERLTDDRFLKDGFYQPKSKDEEKEIHLMATDLTFEKLYKHCAELEKQNAELQKQVDGLNKPIEKFKDTTALLDAYKSLEKEFTRRSQRLRELQGKEKQFAVASHEECTEFQTAIQQAVKDTAKEILQDLYHEFDRIGDEGSCGEIRLIAERYGVEVE